MKRWGQRGRGIGGAATVAVVAAFAPSFVSAEPTMTVSVALVVNDYDTGHPGWELRSNYLVKNTSPATDNYDLTQLTLPAGSNQGVYQTLSPSGWTAQVKADDTVFLPPPTSSSRREVGQTFDSTPTSPRRRPARPELGREGHPIRIPSIR
jgi:hypothetical protein